MEIEKEIMDYLKNLDRPAATGDVAEHIAKKHPGENPASIKKQVLRRLESLYKFKMIDRFLGKGRTRKASYYWGVDMERKSMADVFDGKIPVAEYVNWMAWNERRA